MGGIPPEPVRTHYGGHVLRPWANGFTTCARTAPHSASWRWASVRGVIAMKTLQRLFAITLMVASPNAVGSDLSEHDPPREVEELFEGIKQAIEDLSDDATEQDVTQALETVNLSDDERQLLKALITAAATVQLVHGHTNDPMARFAIQQFMNSNDTEWWRCDDSIRFVMDGGCGGDGCPVTLAANRKMVLGRVSFAGDDAYAQYHVRGLERRWDWCRQDDESFECAFVLKAGGDGSYYDFNAPAATTNSDGQEVAPPAGAFKCERFSPDDRAPAR